MILSSIIDHEGHGDWLCLILEQAEKVFKLNGGAFRFSYASAPHKNWKAKYKKYNI